MGRMHRAAFAALAVSLSLAGCGSGDDPTVGEAMTSDSTTTSSQAEPAARVIELTIAGGAVQGGVRRESVKLGETVTLRATSDVAEELHVHTYDEKVALTPGTPVELTFEATIPGVFEVELEKGHRQVLELEVRP